MGNEMRMERNEREREETQDLFWDLLLTAVTNPAKINLRFLTVIHHSFPYSFLSCSLSLDLEGEIEYGDKGMK